MLNTNKDAQRLTEAWAKGLEQFGEFPTPEEKQVMTTAYKMYLEDKVSFEELIVISFHSLSDGTLH